MKKSFIRLGYTLGIAALTLLLAKMGPSASGWVANFLNPPANVYSSRAQKLHDSVESTVGWEREENNVIRNKALNTMVVPPSPDDKNGKYRVMFGLVKPSPATIFNDVELEYIGTAHKNCLKKIDEAVADQHLNLLSRTASQVSIDAEPAAQPSPESKLRTVTKELKAKVANVLHGPSPAPAPVLEEAPAPSVAP